MHTSRNKLSKRMLPNLVSLIFINGCFKFIDL
jgi:hypothetical protein